MKKLIKQIRNYFEVSIWDVLKVLALAFALIGIFYLMLICFEGEMALNMTPQP